jgi:hypothetical protein
MMVGQVGALPPKMAHIKTKNKWVFISDDAEFIPPRGNCKDLLSFRKTEIVYDLTYDFCHRFLARTDRTVDQMVRAARSGKQNIVEASPISGTSKKAELKLIGCARRSLRKLPNDYHDVLRVRKAPLCPKDSREAHFLGRIGSDPNVTYESLPRLL